MVNQVREVDVFDKEKVFEEKCGQLLRDLVHACSLEKIPFFFTACVKNSFDGSVFVNDAVNTGSRDIHLCDDQIANHMAVARGFDVIPRRQQVEINMDEIDFPD